MNATNAVQWRLSASEKVTLTQLIKTVADAGTPERISATAGTFFRQATFLGKKAARTDNTSSAFLGMTATNDAQAYEIVAGGEITITAPIGCKYDLYDFYLDVGTNADGVVVWYC